MKAILLNIFFILVLGFSYGQSARTELSKNTLKVGEQITLMYSIPIPKHTKPEFLPETTIIPSHTKSKNGILSSDLSEDIEIVEQFRDTILNSKTNPIWIGTYIITVWDSGNYVLASPSIIVDDSTIFFPEIELSCQLVKANQGQDIYDIKESFAEIPDEPFSIKTFVSNNWWWLLILFLAIMSLIFYRLYKRANTKVVRVKELSLKDRTLLAIDSLEEEKLWEKNKLKEHYIELSFILRSYLSSRYSVNLLEKTTKETKLLLQQLALHEETIKVIISVLSQSDMVKFAKSQPEEIDILKVSQLARQVVAETSPIEFENVV